MCVISLLSVSPSYVTSIYLDKQIDTCVFIDINKYKYETRVCLRLRVRVCAYVCVCVLLHGIYD